MINRGPGFLPERLLDKLQVAQLFLPFPQGPTFYRKELRHWLKGELQRKFGNLIR